MCFCQIPGLFRRGMIMAIRWLGLVPALLLVVGTGYAEAQDVKLDGTWKVMKLEAGGQSAPEDLVKEARMIFKGDKVTVKGVSDRERESSFKTDAKQKPMQIDIVRGDRVTKGIFKLEGEMLTI